MTQLLPLRRVLPGVLPLALALCSAPGTNACEKSACEKSPCTTSTPVAGEPDVGAMASVSPSTPALVLELAAQRPGPDLKARTGESPATTWRMLAKAAGPAAPAGPGVSGRARDQARARPQAAGDGPWGGPAAPHAGTRSPLN
jgi:hypothetical protein